MNRRLLFLILALATVLVACGDDDTASNDTTTTTAADDGDADADAGADAAGGGSAVTAAGFAFDPATLEVSAGTTVTWTNEDGVAHTVTAGSPGDASGEFDESLDAGGEATVTFDEAGTFPYFCSIHPDMTAEIVVT